MAKTLLNCQTTTRRYLDEAVQVDWTDTEVIMAVNEAYHDVVGYIIEVYENYYETINPFTYAMVANQQEYPVDVSLIKITRAEINYTPTSSNSMPIRAIAIKADELRLNLSNNSYTGNFMNAGYYFHGSIGTQTVGFVPIPVNSDTGSDKSISIWGIGLPTDLVNPTDNVNIPYADRYYSLVCKKAAALLLRKGQQEETAAARYLQEYRIEISDAQTFIKERQIDGPWMITDAQGDSLDFGFPL